jgi:hypothetical protein
MYEIHVTHANTVAERPAAQCDFRIFEESLVKVDRHTVELAERRNCPGLTIREELITASFIDQGHRRSDDGGKLLKVYVIGGW